MHPLFLQGWNHQIADNLQDALKCYTEAIALGDKCAQFHWNCMDRYGQGMAVNFNNSCKLSDMVLNDEEFYLLMKCYESHPTMEHRFNVARLYDTRKEYQKSFHIYKDLDYAPAQHCVALAYKFGDGIDINLNRASDWFIKAGTNNMAPGTKDGWYLSYIHIGNHYHDNKDYLKAHEWFLKGAKYGCNDCQNNLGLLYVNGQGVDKDYQQAHKWFHIGANQRHSDSCKNLYEIYSKGLGVTQDYNEAIKWLTIASEEGDRGAQTDLGLLYSKGIHIPKDIPEALKWLTLAGEAKDESALYELISIYEKLNDFKQLHHWFSIKAEMGLADGQVNLGLLYVRGQGVIQNFSEGVKWFQLAVDQNNLWAQGELGRLYVDGEGIPKDTIKGLYLIYSSATKGYDYGQYNLGKLYYDGNITPKNIPEAIKWWSLASDQGNLDSQYQLGLHYLTIKDYTQAHKYFTLVIQHPYFSSPNTPPVYVSNTKDHLTNLNKMSQQILMHLNHYKSFKNDEGVSYLFFCNFLNFLIQQMSSANPHDPLFRIWITDHLFTYFKNLNPEFSRVTISDWFADLFGE